MGRIVSARATPQSAAAKARKALFMRRSYEKPSATVNSFAAVRVARTRFDTTGGRFYDGRDEGAGEGSPFTVFRSANLRALWPARRRLLRIRDRCQQSCQLRTERHDHPWMYYKIRGPSPGLSHASSMTITHRRIISFSRCHLRKTGAGTTRSRLILYLK